MIQGRVNARNEAIVSLRLRGMTGVELDVECLIDTGFDGELVLPAAIATAAGFLYLGPNTATVAGGSSQSYETYLGQFLWNGVFRDSFVACIGDEPLIGMALLSGHELRIEVTPGGMVEINELP